MTADQFLDHFAPVRRVGARYTAECPVHEDRSRDTLHITVKPDGRRLVICRAGCRVIDVLTAKHLQFRDLFPETGAPQYRTTPITDRTPWPRLVRLALIDVYREARRRQAIQQPIYAAASEIRGGHRLIDAARALATETECGWTLLALAATVERDVFTRESL